jgi:predicted DNA-binding protein (MmcQ/YjbR family)
MIDTELIDSFCLSLSGTRKEYKEEWEVFRYLLNDKMYLMVGQNKEGTNILTLKGNPEENQKLREQYSEVEPGYYMNKEHWVSIPLKTNMTQEQVHQCLQKAYELVLASFSKKKQAELLEQVK